MNEYERPNEMAMMDIAMKILEDELEYSINQNVIEIYVDEYGTFFYNITDKAYQKFKKQNKNLERTMKTYFDVAVDRGFSEDYVSLYLQNLQKNEM